MLSCITTSALILLFLLLLSMDVLSKEKRPYDFHHKVSYYIILSQIDYSKVDDNNHVFEEVLHDYLLQQYVLDP